ncbi:MAG: N-acetyltransferase [Anaerolineales bacterium]|nr:N-acetyltransferase [Anaerolineales bacterium]MCX7609039.1 N-acetyltransferase [Anaerolineales bacterium]MDW8226622.1 GNAT family N-acetyltransferase [Anaerolineales bacterium]
MTGNAIEIVHNPEKNRFELEQDGLLCVLEYYVVEGTMVFTHTEVPSALGGRGLGSRLAQAGLEYARQQGLKVRPLCSFIAGYIQKHPEYQDLL